MPAQFKLSDETSTALKTLIGNLRLEFDTLSQQYEDSSEKWRETDAGQQVDAWLEALDNLLSDADNFQHNAVDLLP